MAVNHLGILSLIKPRQKVNESKDRFALLVEILKEAKTGAIKTRVLRNYNLNSLAVDFYIRFLLEKELLSKEIDDNGQEQILTTEKGNDFVQNFLVLQSFSNKIPVFVHHNVIYRLD
jgi:predicted transcriptional regulator